MSRVKHVLVIAALGAVGVVPAALGSASGAVAAAPAARPGVTVTAALRGTSRPLRDLPAAATRQPNGGPLPLHLRTPAAGAHAPTPATAVAPADQTAQGTRTALAVGTGFDAISYTDFASGQHYAPPDNNSDVGPHDIVEMVNPGVAVFGKDGSVKVATKLISDLFGSSSAVGGAGSTVCATRDDGDPIVRYDPLANRWVLSQFAIPTAYSKAGPNYECVAVSQTADPGGSYWLYAFPDSNGWAPDYPKLGVWPDAYYMTFNEFSGDFSTNEGTRSCALDRAKMLKGQDATQQCFNLPMEAGANTLLPADLDGSVPPPPGAPNYEVSIDPYHYGATLYDWAFHVDWTTPANSTFTELAGMPVADYGMLCGSYTRQACIPQKGSTNVLESLGDRLMFSLSYRNFGDHQSLLAVHSVTDTGAATVGGERWYELRVGTDGSLSVYQSGTYAPDDGLYRFMGSMAMDQAGDAAMGFSVSSSAVYPSIRLTARYPGDAAGTMGYAETDVLDGAHSESGTFSDKSLAERWGDYTSMNIDPSDDCTFWYTNQVYLQDDATSWGTHIASVRVPRCASSDFAMSVPASVVAGNSASIAVATTQTKGTGSSATIRVNGPAGLTGGSGSVTTGGTKTISIGTAGVRTGTYRIRVIVHSAFAVHSAVLTLKVDHAKPTAALTAPTAPFVLGPSTAVKWSGSDTGGSGLAYYQLESRQAPYTGGFTAWALSSTHYTGTSTTTGSLARGSTYCWRVRAVDKVGNVGAWSGQRCTAVPLDDTQTAASSGWTTLSSSAYWNGSLRRSSTLNATLTRSGAHADRVAVVVTRCSTCGDIDVYVGSKKIGRVYLASSTTAYKQVVVLPAFAATSGTVTLKVVTSGKPVFVDGVGISQS